MKTKQNVLVLLVTFICSALVVSCSLSGGGNSKPQPTATTKAPLTGGSSNSDKSTGSGSKPQPTATNTKTESADTNNTITFPSKPETPPSDIFDQFVFIGQGGGEKCPSVGKLDDQIFLNCFEANQEVRILLYKSEGFMLPGDFFAEFFRRVDSKGELTLTVKNGKSTGYIYVVLDAKTHKELYPDENDCPKRSWSQLKENVTARITFTDGTPLRLRDKPSTVFGDIVDEFDEGTRLKITNGPICSQEYLWWQVSVSGVNGWMAEGDGKVRFLEPWK